MVILNDTDYDAATENLIDEIKDSTGKYPSGITARIIDTMLSMCADISLMKQKMIAVKLRNTYFFNQLEDARRLGSERSIKIRELRAEIEGLKLKDGGLVNGGRPKKKATPSDISWVLPSFSR